MLHSLVCLLEGPTKVKDAWEDDPKHGSWIIEPFKIDGSEWEYCTDLDFVFVCL